MFNATIFRDLKATIVTLGSVILVVTAVIGFLQIFGYQFSVIDGIAIPIIMGVAVDGAFWYKSSSKSKYEVREILFNRLRQWQQYLWHYFLQLKRNEDLFVMITGIVLTGFNSICFGRFLS